MHVPCPLLWLLTGGAACAAGATSPAAPSAAATTAAGLTEAGATATSGAPAAAAMRPLPSAPAGRAAGAGADGSVGNARGGGEGRVELPAILAPNAGGPPRGAAGGGRSGASKRLRELLDRPASGRAVSPEMAAKLGEAVRRAAPPAAAATGSSPTPAAPAEAGDAVMLDPFVVEDDKLPQMKEREMLTPAGRLAEARRRQPGLSLGAIPLRTDGLASQMIGEDFARERREEEKELRGWLKTDGRDVPADVKKQIDAGAARRKSWIDERGTSFRPPK